MMLLALYKGTRPGVYGLYNRLARFLDRGIYSHCELIFSNGLSASSSFLDGGVRFKRIGYTEQANWDFLDLSNAPQTLEASAIGWFKKHEGEKYDILGNLRFATNFARDSGDKWFCSESVMAALGFSEAYRYGPCGMVPLLRHHFDADYLSPEVLHAYLRVGWLNSFIDQ